MLLLLCVSLFTLCLEDKMSNNAFWFAAHSFAVCMFGAIAYSLKIPYWIIIPHSAMAIVYLIAYIKE